MSKATPRIILALNDIQIRRSLDRHLSSHFQTVPALREQEIRSIFAQSSTVAAVITEAMLDNLPGLKILELTRSLQSQALRIMASNFDEISTVVEGVHNGLVQRVLGIPFTEADVRALFSGGAPSGPARAAIAPAFAPAAGADQSPSVRLPTSHPVAPPFFPITI